MDIRFEMTCGACPEQYDAIDENGTVVGYLRLRHGFFRVDCPNCGGDVVYQATTIGDGIFDYEERDFYLDMAKLRINQYYEVHPVPEPDYETTEEILEGRE